MAGEAERERWELVEGRRAEGVVAGELK